MMKRVAILISALLLSWVTAAPAGAGNGDVSGSCSSSGTCQAELEKMAMQHSPREFPRALRASRKGPAVIAELKKASPSRGLIWDHFSVPELARELKTIGVTLSQFIDAIGQFDTQSRNPQVTAQKGQRT